MAMETMLALSAATGRTLVLPPEAGMYLLNKDDEKKENNKLDFEDFFMMDEITDHLEGVDVIHMEQFLELEAVGSEGLREINDDTGDLSDAVVPLPRHGLTNWNNVYKQGELFEYLRKVGYVRNMSPQKEFLVFPKDVERSEEKDVMYLLEQEDMWVDGKPVDMIERKNEKVKKAFYDNPTKVAASPVERMREFYAGRGKMHVYDKRMQDPKILHFPVDHKQNSRMLTHFYTFLFFEDYKIDLWIKRIIRDHVRYRDEIFCGAARVLEKVREKALEHDKNCEGSFDSFHIRRGDFQYKETRLSAAEIDAATADVLTPGRTVFIATDEFDRAFFADLDKKYNLLFLADFMNELEGVNKNYFGMIDQLVSARGKVFIGTWFSTFTGYINRMRGYHKDYKDEITGGGGGKGVDEYGKKHDGLVESYYFARPRDKLEMVQYVPIRPPFYPREWPMGWRNIDDHEE
jgi:hypothetical protein